MLMGGNSEIPKCIILEITKLNVEMLKCSNAVMLKL